MAKRQKPLPKHNSGSVYVRIASSTEAQQKGFRVVQGKGSHAKVYSPNNEMTPVPVHSGDLATGTESAIRKWFVRMGLITVVALAVVANILT